MGDRENERFDLIESVLGINSGFSGGATVIEKFDDLNAKLKTLEFKFEQSNSDRAPSSIILNSIQQDVSQTEIINKVATVKKYGVAGDSFPPGVPAMVSSTNLLTYRFTANDDWSRYIGLTNGAYGVGADVITTFSGPFDFTDAKVPNQRLWVKEDGTLTQEQPSNNWSQIGVMKDAKRATLTGINAFTPLNTNIITATTGFITNLVGTTGTFTNFNITNLTATSVNLLGNLTGTTSRFTNLYVDNIYERTGAGNINIQNDMVLGANDVKLNRTSKLILNDDDVGDNYIQTNGDEIEIWQQGVKVWDIGTFGTHFNSAAGGSLFFAEGGVDKALIQYTGGSNKWDFFTDDLAGANARRLRIAGEVDSATVEWENIASIDYGSTGLQSIASITMDEDGWIGIASGSESIHFDGTAGTVSILNANLGVGFSGAARVPVHVKLDSGTAAFGLETTTFGAATLYLHGLSGGYLSYPNSTTFYLGTAAAVGGVVTAQVSLTNAGVWKYDAVTNVNFNSATQTGVASITMDEDGWIGIASGSERVVFNGTAGRVEIQGADLFLPDGANIVMGTGGDSTFGFDSNDVVLNPDAVGSGEFRVNGKTRTNGELECNGDIIPVGEGTGLLFGEIYCYDSATTVTIISPGIANKAQITCFDTNGLSNGMTPDHTNDHITVDTAGKYLCTVSITALSGTGSGFEAGFAVYKNNGATLFQNCHAHRQLSGGGGDTGSISISGIIDLAASDTIELWCWNETNGADIVIDDVTMSLACLGGT